MEDDGADVVGGAPALAISGFESEGYTLSEIVRGKRIEIQILSEGVVDTTRSPQFEILNLRNLP